eukprot:3010608-Rhodomonas_salina.1
MDRARLELSIGAIFRPWPPLDERSRIPDCQTCPPRSSGLIWSDGIAREGHSPRPHAHCLSSNPVKTLSFSAVPTEGQLEGAKKEIPNH